MGQPITWDFFRGEAPKFAPRQLPPGYAQLALRAKLYDGKMKPWFKMKEVATLTKSGEVQSIYPMRSAGQTYWLEWTEVVDVVPARAVSDTTQRIAFTGYGTPKATNFDIATTSTSYPKQWWRLGVPAPITACSAALGAGGTGVARDRTYIVVFIHLWADGKTEMSGPSPASAVVAAKSGQTVDLTNIPRWIITPVSITRTGDVATVTIPGGHVGWFGNKDLSTIAGADQAEYNGVKEITRISDTQFSYAVSGAPVTPATGTITVKSNHSIVKKQIFRTVVGNAGAFLRFVAEIDESTTTYSDSSTDTSIALNEVLPSLDTLTLKTWDMPPLDMHSIIDCGNGMLAGLSGNQICFSEPYFYHAWPEVYRRALPFAGVGLGIIGSTVVVPTEGYPVTFTGSHPAAMAEAKRDRLNHPCLSKRGVLSIGYAVKYPSKDGLVSFSSGAAGVETNEWHDRETWAKVFPDTMRAFQFNDRYFGAFQSGSSGGVKVGGAVIIDRENNIGGQVSDDRYFSGGHFDVTTASLFLIQNNKVYEWDGDTANREIMNWKSAKVILPAPMNLGAARVEAEFAYTAAEVAAINAAAAAAQAANDALLGDETIDADITSFGINDLELNGDDAFQDGLGAVDQQNFTFHLYVNGVLKFTKPVLATGSFRLPEGYKSDDIEWLLSGNGIVHRVQLAENMRSLAGK